MTSIADANGPPGLASTGAEPIVTEGLGSPATDRGSRGAFTRPVDVGSRWASWGIRTAVVWLALFGGGALIVHAITTEVMYDDPLVMASFGINGAIAALGLAWANTRDGVSLRVIFWFFSLLFLCVAPLGQYRTGRWMFELRAEMILFANAIILLYFAAFSVAARWGAASARRAIRRDARVPRVMLDGYRLLALALLGLVVVVGFISAVGLRWEGSMVLGAFGDTYTSVSMATEFFLRPAIFFLFLFALFMTKMGVGSRSFGGLVVATTFVAAMLMIGPLSGSRFLIFALYFGLLIIVYPPTGRRRSLYLGVLILGIFGAYVHKAGVEAAFSDEGVSSFTLARYFYQGHFDAYESFVHSLAYVRDHGPFWGRQFLGSLLFWVPRDLWPGKPIGTATTIFSTYLSEFFPVTHTNVAAPLVEEAYVNFHVPGVVVVAALAGAACGYADRRYQGHLRSLVSRARRPGRHMFADQPTYMVLYPVMVGMWLFILRGDLLSGAAFATGLVLAFVVVKTIVVRRIRVRRRGRA